MALNFTGRRWHDDQTGTVIFPAWSGSTRVQCRITDEALMLMFGAVRTDTGLLEAFDRYLSPIQVAAAWKFESLGDPLQFVISSSDFPDRKPIQAPQIKQMSPEEVRLRIEQLRRTRPSDTPEELASMIDALATGIMEAEALGEGDPTPAA